MVDSNFCCSATSDALCAAIPFRRSFTSNVSYSASPSLSFSNLMQYDIRSRNLGWQGRVRRTLQPGNDLFVAFNHG
jgi:hypothetical protein